MKYINKFVEKIRNKEFLKYILWKSGFNSALVFSSSFIQKLYEKIFITPLFGKSRDVMHIWSPKNYLSTSSIYWKLVQLPMEKRGIYLPLPFNKIKDKAQFQTFHNEHLVLDKFMKKTNTQIENVFIDIGASDGVDMSNTFNLILEDYKGFCFELDDSKFAKMATIYRDFHDINLFKMKITPDNVSKILESLDLPEIIKVLNLDIDSYDYFVLEKLLNDFKFQFLILEINPIFPMSVDFAVEYDELFNWSGDSFQGASVSMFYKLLNKNGYSLIWIDRSFVLALNNNLITEEIKKIEPNEIDKIINRTLKENDNYRWQRYKKIRTSSPEDVISIVKEDFKNYKNFYIEKSNFT